MSASSAIERTAEYEKFMKDLKAFHDQKGTLLQPEPVLGGKRLDLLKIYKIVLEAGGYEKVTLNRGWKQVGDPFHFPATCTNSAYQLKSYYTKYLLGWEEEFYWKRPWNPPTDLLANNQLQQKASSPLPQPQPTQQQTRQQTGTAFKSIQQQQYQPHPSVPQQQQPPSVFYPPAIFMDQEFRTRILLSLQSNLPNEVDWAFNTLIKFSFASENFCLDFIPTLIDLLLDFTVDFFQLHMAGGDVDDLFCSRSQQEIYERVLQVFHILRNFSFLEMNIRRLALHERLRFLLMKGIALSPASQYGELSRHCLDILENIAPQVSLVNREDDYFVTMTQLLFSNDRAFILGAIRALTRVAVTETNERVLGFANLDVIERMAQFLMVDDEELEAAALEYLYQYSSLRGNFSTQLVKCYPGNLIGLLTGFLSYKSSLAPPSTTAIGTIHGIPAAQMASHLNDATASGATAATEQPTIPDLTNYSHLDEPYRCLGWLKDQLITGGPEDIIILKDIFGEYRKLFGTEKPLGMKEFYTVLKIAFPQPPAVEEAFNSSGAPLDTVLQNVKYSPTRRRDGPICHWNECSESFDTQVELHKHIIHQHISKDDLEPQQCQWMKCTRHNLNKGQAIHHLRTHFVATNTITKIQKKLKPKPFMIPKIPTDDSEVSGIPLTSALLLRNLARYKQHHTFYLPYESELTLLAIQRPKVSKYILTVLTELQAS